RRCRAVPRRSERGRLRARDGRPARDPARPRAAGGDRRAPRARRRPDRTCRIDRGSIAMKPYDKPAELYDGLRLHQNEHTGGCSPRVLEALANLRAEEVAFYPPYAAATRACAAYL